MKYRHHRPSRWDRAELAAKLAVALAGAGYAIAQTAEILSHIHW
jgi:hypothetical protein